MVLLHGVVIGLGIIRWWLLLRVVGFDAEFKDVSRRSILGFFFNLLIPGSVSGDLVKMTMLTRKTPGARTEAAFTVAVDRVLGLFALFLLAAPLVVAFLPWLLALKKGWVSTAAVVVALGSVVGVVLFVMVESRRFIARHRWMVALVDKLRSIAPARVMETADRLVEATELYRRHKAVIAVAILLSLAVHTVFALDFYFAALAVGKPVLGFLEYMLTTQVANAFAAVPITPAGLGTRDAVVAAFFSSMGMEDELAGVIPVVLTMAVLFWGVVGAAVLIFSPDIKEPAMREVITEAGKNP